MKSDNSFLLMTGGIIAIHIWSHFTWYTRRSMNHAFSISLFLEFPPRLIHFYPRLLILSFIISMITIMLLPSNWFNSIEYISLPYMSNSWSKVSYNCCFRTRTVWYSYRYCKQLSRRACSFQIRIQKCTTFNNLLLRLPSLEVQVLSKSILATADR